MNKIDNLLKNHDFKSELMNDKSFVSASKKMFEEQDVEFSREQLEDIVGDICDNLEKVRKMPEKELVKVVGGVQTINVGGLSANVPGSKPKTKKGVVIEATTTILGTVIGSAVGFTLGGFKFTSTDNYKVRKDGSKKLVSKSEQREFSPGSAMLVGGTGGLAGSVLGFQLGQLIVKKYNL